MNSKKIVRALFFFQMLIGAALGQETLPPILDGKAPQTFEELWAGYDPRAEPLESEVLKEWEEDGVMLQVLRYRIGIFKGQKAMMAAVYGYPAGETNLPGLVQIHGGGQYADYRAVLTNAKRGYATISIAWAGRISAPGYTVDPEGVKLFWDGKTDDPEYKLTTDWGALDAYHAPCKNPKNHFGLVEPASWTLDPVESPRNNPWFLCVLGARRALTFLEQQPQVDPDSLGVYGHSMGGKLAVMTAGADPRVKAAAPSCGGVSNRYSDNALYEAAIGDDVYLKRISCPIIFLSPSNDFHGHINDLQKAIQEISSKEWRVTCSPHHNHQDTAEYQIAGLLWFDQYLRGDFAFPQTPKTSLDLSTKSHTPVFTVQPDASKPILSVDIYYTQQGYAEGEKENMQHTINRFWHHAEAVQKGDSWTAPLPLLSTDRPLWVYANVLYPLDEPVTGAGYYYAVYTAETFNLSSTMHIASADELKAASVEATMKPSLVIETFEDGWQKEWFTYDLSDNWARRTHKLYNEKWQAPPHAKLALEVSAEQPNKMVVGLDSYAAEIQTVGDSKWQRVILSPSDFHNALGKMMIDWNGLKELRLTPRETLREKADGKDVTLNLGAEWKGPKPRFRKLEWITDVERDVAGAEPTWHSQWIGLVDDCQPNTWYCFRKQVELNQVPRQVIARIACDSKYWLWINEERVVFEGQLKRGPTPYDTYYDEVELAPFLRKGRNTIAVLVWYWGKDGFSHNSSGRAGLLFEADLNGKMLVSDNSWKVRLHPAYSTAEGSPPNFRLSESRVLFDARKDMKGWYWFDFNDTEWSHAVEFGRPPADPWNRLWPRCIPQWKDYGLRAYENAAALPKESAGTPIYAKLPYNAQVTPWLRIDAPAGLLIKIATDNSANEIYAEYITREGVQEFEAPAWMNGHQVIFHIPKGVKVLGLKYRETGYDTELSGYFTCDQEFYNRLWAKAQRTLYITMRDNFMDCPDRERAAWWGDIVIELGEVFYSLSPSSHSLIRKCMYDLAGWQRPSKTLFSPIPAGNWDKELPQQMLASIGKYGFWTYYLYTGDAETISDLYPHVRDYLSIWQTDEEGLVVHRSGENGWDWGDWGDNVDMRVMDNAWFCLALDGAARMADVIGKPEEAVVYRRRRNSIIASVNRVFWTGSAYRAPDYSGATDDRANGLAVVAGIAGPEKFAAIKAVLARERHASPYIEKYVLESLFIMDAPDAALARMQDRYREIVASPLTTLPELFNNGGTNNHAWSGGPLTLMDQYVAGIVPTSPGFAAYQVKPQLGPLTLVNAGFDSVRGRIDVAIERTSERFALRLASPGETTAKVCIPVGEYGFRSIGVHGKAVWQNGKAADAVKGVTFAGETDGYVCFTVAPGIWKFEATHL